MRSVKTKIIVLVLSCVIAAAILIGGTSIINSRSVVDTDSVQILNLLCENRTNNINNLLNSVEKSVDSLTVFAQGQIGDLNKLKNDPQYFQQYTQRILDVAINASKNTAGAITVYTRFNAETFGSTAGFFYQCNEVTGLYEPLPPTDLSLYNANQSEYVNWYYRPIEAGYGVWLKPYYNENINSEIISYVVPFYINGELVGVVGMDLDFSILENVVANTHVYQTGYAFLTDDESIIMSHQSLARNSDLFTISNGEFKNMAKTLETNTFNENNLLEYTFDGNPKKATFRILSNNMRLVLSVPVSEIDQKANQLLFQIIATTTIILAVIILLTFIFTRRLVKPLFELTEAAKKIAKGDLQVTITHQSNDEVGILAESFRQTVVHLDNYFTYVNSLAYKDSLTGIKNKTAYQEIVLSIEEDIEDNEAKFAVIVFDINDLKIVNDTYGHHEGDCLIINACQVIGLVFMGIPVYRIGGDEFVVILNQELCDKNLELLAKFDKELKIFNQNNRASSPVSIARGIAVYQKEVDTSYNDVFERADNAMYFDKEQSKKNK